MGTKYSTVSISNYNATPPADDGSQVASNKIYYSTIKTKLSDPLKTAIESINTGLLEELDVGPDAHTSSYTTVAADYNTVLEVTNATTITLLDPSTAGAGYHVTVKNAGSDTVTVAEASLIDGDPSVALASQEALTFIVNSSGSSYLALCTARASSQNWSFVAEKTASSANELEFFHDGIDNAGADLVDGYSYAIEMNRVFTSADNIELYLTLFEGSYRVAAASYLQHHWEVVGGTSTATSVTATEGVVALCGDTAINGAIGWLELVNLASTTYSSAAESEFFSYTDAGAAPVMANYASRVWTSSLLEASTKFKIAPASGTVSGIFKLYRRG